MNISNLDLNLLFVFDALVTHRSVTIAARYLNLSQPATSHALNRLREALDDELFVRSSAGMFPTDKALRLQDSVRDILQRIQNQLFEDDTFDPTKTKRFLECYPLKSYKPPIALTAMQVEMVWHKRTTNSQPHKWLREQIRNAVAEMLNT